MDFETYEATENQLENLKPSDWIFLALKDLEKTEQSSDYTVDMYEYHIYHESDNLCHVCFAGGILAHTLHWKKDKYILRRIGSTKEDVLPSYYPIIFIDMYPSFSNYFFALNAIRKGDVDTFFQNIGLPYTDKDFPLTKFHFYDNNPELFKECMRLFAQSLTDKGL